MTGKFISFEGPDGAGKTSVLHAILDRLTPMLGEQLVITREPGGRDNQVAEAIRDLVLSPAYPAMDPWTEAMLYAAARRQHVVETIRPALADDKVIISDRYLDSSIAYQGGGRELGAERVADLNQYATNGLQPQATIYLDLAPEVGLARIQATRQDEINRLDVEALAFHQRVSAAYHDLIAADPDRFWVIDASQPLEQVVADAWDAMQHILTLPTEA
ncbi:thymidylate kinase [Weissella viridescens]|uniref:Thymidylate kinase n=1 Tax=Weissella viridescens TaxID=1629 RepID=A0A0R2H1C6_WEIVI|nr:dTMP kinase [Weissella viridescens]KRN46424.1 thymidylate kinase [Weissella viridescens]GEA94799.1 thymidylate kinase [Weissella viridescens]SOB42961.1 thymidylate kinase [Weissella viridescens]SUP52579.1 Thymidylate kinase [Weissella viridescens]